MRTVRLRVRGAAAAVRSSIVRPLGDVRYAFPYGWSWNLAMAFGSILAATDPVAVVALLKAVLEMTCRIRIWCLNN